MVRRSRHLPGALARFAIFSSALVIAMGAAMIVYPEDTSALKAVGAPFFFTEVATTLWLLFKGLQPRATAEARA